AVRLADLEQPVVFTTEPEAAAIFYAHQQRIPSGAIVAVYDLGGGTFDAAVLRKTDAGFEILGQPEGIERLGGIDFDAAVFEHVRRAIGDKLEELDEEDPAAVAAVARLREECVQAKEALSSDTDVSIPVLLPNLATEVRLTRAELEAMVRPTLYSSIEALQRALRSANVTPEQLHSVLLVGGSSRMPIVAQLVGAELNRPVTVDAHPKNAVALGAAWLASTRLPGQQRQEATPSPEPVSPIGSPSARAHAQPVTPTVPTPTTYVSGGERHAADHGAPPPPPRSATSPKRRPTGLLIGAGVLVVLLAGGGVALAMNFGDTDGDKQNTAGTSGPSTAGSAEPTGEVTPTESQLPPDEQCTDEIKANDRWVCLTSAVWDGNQLVIEYEADWAGGEPSVRSGYHLHIWGGDGTYPPAEIMGAHHPDRGTWKVMDKNPAVLSASDYTKYVGDDATKVCARIADSRHRLVEDANGTYQTGNCVPIERS
ncbi:MAG TPA: Hsp70 family protein, partial [Micromonosporaceae bacterium]